MSPVPAVYPTQTPERAEVTVDGGLTQIQIFQSGPLIRDVRFIIIGLGQVPVQPFPVSVEESPTTKLDTAPLSTQATPYHCQ